MKETIEWHKYPDEKPKSGGRKLVQFELLDGRINTIFAYYGSFNSANCMPRTFYYVDTYISVTGIFAWAEMPKGYKEDK